MIVLKQERYGAARAFLKTRARHVDRALFEFRFEAGDGEAVVEALGEYQNPDGGFGKALEPDVRTPSSSALATALALATLREVGCEGSAPEVGGALQYLLDTFDAKSKVWRAIPEDANAHPHAPWWHDDDGSLARTFDRFKIVPRTVILASLHTYRRHVPEDWLADVTEDCVRFIETAPVDALRSDGFAWSRELAEAPGLPPEWAGRVQQRLAAIVPEVVSTDPAEWSGYCLPPLKAAPRPSSLAVSQLRDALDVHLDYTIRAQSPGGAWEPTWTWGESYPKAWVLAKEEWRGQLTVETLTSLREYNRLEK